LIIAEGNRVAPIIGRRFWNCLASTEFIQHPYLRDCYPSGSRRPLLGPLSFGSAMELRLPLRIVDMGERKKLARYA